MQKLHVWSTGLALGVLSGLVTLLTALSTLWFGYGTDFVDLVGTFYIGYEATVGGAIIGGIWGFVDGLIGGSVFAWLYNSFVRRR